MPSRAVPGRAVTGRANGRDEVFQTYGADELQDLLDTFDAASVEESTDILRRLIADRNQERAAK